jgi:hypothetical protein
MFSDAFYLHSSFLLAMQVWCAWGEMELRQAEHLSEQAEAAATAASEGAPSDDDPDELASEAAAGYQAALEVIIDAKL